MHRISRDAVVTLAAQIGFPRVSIYLPAEGAGPMTASDQTAVKSAVQRASSLLVTRGMRPEDVRRLLRPVPEFSNDAGIWQRPGGGVAMFLAPDWFRGYRVDARFQPAVYAGKRFLTRQLLPMVGVADRLLVLALSGKQARLVEVAGDAISESPVALPQGLEGLPWRSEAQPDLQFHGLGRQTTSHGQPLYHGHGAGTDSVKDRTEEYVRHIEARLRPVLMPRDTPLVFAGVESLAAMYRAVNTYPHLAEAIVAGNPDELTSAQLGERALDAAYAELQVARNAAAGRHARLAGSARALTRLEEVLQAAGEGRILHLFLADEAETWGRYDAATGITEIMGRDDVDAEDLVDVAAQMTLARGGEVYSLPRQDMPGDPPHKAVAAVLRY